MRLLQSAFCAGIIFLSTNTYAANELTNDQIRQEIIRQSLASYPGNCPCPYNADRRGHSCGLRSAYSKPGGYSPLCYPSDVSDEMVETYRKLHREN